MRFLDLLLFVLWCAYCLSGKSLSDYIIQNLLSIVQTSLSLKTPGILFNDAGKNTRARYL